VELKALIVELNRRRAIISWLDVKNTFRDRNKDVPIRYPSEGTAPKMNFIPLPLERGSFLQRKGAFELIERRFHSDHAHSDDAGNRDGERHRVAQIS